MTACLTRSRIMSSSSFFPRMYPRRLFASRRRQQNWVGTKEDIVERDEDKLRVIGEELKAESRRLGFSLIGITSPRASSRFEKYKEWLENNYHGELDYMAREDRTARREKPCMILPGVQSVIMVGMHYWPGKSGFPASHNAENHFKAQPESDEARGIMSSYAWGEDYHTILSARLKGLGKHLNDVAGGIGRFYVDTGAILERDFAERANLGFIGKNSLLINRNSGSGFFIGELFSTVKLEYDGDTDYGVKKRRGAGCGKCQKCRIACPTGAIVEDYVVDARKCISYLTIELKGSIPKELRRGMGARIYGCDICQLVCPWNKYAWEGKSEGFSPMFGQVGQDVSSPKLRELVEMSKEEFEKRFEGSAVKRIGRERMIRNAVVAMGNVGGLKEVEILKKVGEKEGEMIGEHAEWSVGEILEREERQREKQ